MSKNGDQKKQKFVINEGLQKKGGLNYEPKSPPPPPPKAQGGSGAQSQGGSSGNKKK